MKVALVHDQLAEFGGAERVLISLKQIFPEAPVYTSFYHPSSLGIHAEKFKNWDIRQSFAKNIPFVNKLYSPLRFLAPKIWESFDFDKYDVVISSSGWYMSKGISVKKPTIHISYLHHPPRYLYGYETAFEWKKYWPVKIYAIIVNHFLRMWDFESSQKVDYFIANSVETQRRIKKFYRRESSVIYPPVKINPNYKAQSSNQIQSSNTKNYFITVSRLTKAKHIDLLIEAASKLKFNLKIVGTGRDAEYLRSIAGHNSAPGSAGSTVEFLGHVEDSELGDLHENAKAFLFASVDEEFGIAPVEAMGYGVPVIAYKSGGLVETVKDGANGFLFDLLTVESLAQSIKKLESLSDEKYLTMRKEARKMAEKFSEERFKKEILEFVRRHSGK